MLARLAGLTLALVLSLCGVASAADPFWHLQIDAGDGFSLNDVSCSTPTLCLAVGASGIAAIEDGSYLYNERPQASAPFNAISCVSGQRFCMAADDQGKVLPWVNGEFGAFTNIAGNVALLSISCPTITFCMAIDNQDATWQYDGSTWTKRQLTKPGSGNVQTKVSCASPSFCVAVTEATDGMRYAVWNGTVWTGNTAKVDAAAANPRSLTCTATTFCVVTTNTGKAGRFNGTTWTVTQVTATTNGGIPLVASCAGTDCRAIDQNVNTYSSPDGVTWTGAGNAKATSSLSAPSAVFCAAKDLCVAISTSNASTFAPSIIPTAKPVVSGTGKVGQTLSVAHGPVPETRAWFATQWWRCDNPGSTCTRIRDANGPTYTVTADDAGKYVEARDNTGIGLDEEGARNGNPVFVSNPIHVDAPAPPASASPAPAASPSPSPSVTPAPVPVPKFSASVKTGKTAVTIAVKCPGPGRCKGTVKLVVKKKTLGKKAYSTPSGTQQFVKVKLGRAVRKLLKRKRKVKATLTVTPAVGKVLKKTVTLKR